MAKSRAISTRVIRVQAPRRRSRSRANGLPLAVIAGFIPMVSTPLKMYMGGSFDAGNWHLIRNLTGINRDDGKFDVGAVTRSWGPVLAGIVIHKLVGEKLGVNRMLKRAGVPLLRV